MVLGFVLRVGFAGFPEDGVKIFGYLRLWAVCFAPASAPDSHSAGLFETGHFAAFGHSRSGGGGFEQGRDTVFDYQVGFHVGSPAHVAAGHHDRAGADQDVEIDKGEHSTDLRVEKRLPVRRLDRPAGVDLHAGAEDRAIANQHLATRKQAGIRPNLHVVAHDQLRGVVDAYGANGQPRRLIARSQFSVTWRTVLAKAVASIDNCFWPLAIEIAHNRYVNEDDEAF